MAESEKLLELRFPASASKLKDVRVQVHDAASRGGCSAECADEVVLAVDEACQNVIRHAYAGDESGEIVLQIERADDRLLLWLRDFAPRIDPARVEPRDLENVRPGGLGVHLIRELMDECGFVPEAYDEGNLFRMSKQVR